MSAASSKRSPSVSDLESRVTYRKQSLISEIVEHKKNSCRAGAADSVDKIKDRLSELAHIMKSGAANDWANVDPSAALRLEEWIAK